jgi:hypothetical protein
MAKKKHYRKRGRGNAEREMTKSSGRWLLVLFKGALG